MKFLKAIIVFSALVMITGGCRKYEDGPLISLRSAQKRVEGNWITESIVLNGVTQTAITTYHTAVLCDDSFDVHHVYTDIDHFKFGSREFKYLNTGEVTHHLWNSCEVTYVTESIASNYVEGTWAFDNKNTQLVLAFTNPSWWNQRIWRFDITRLTDREMTLSGVIEDFSSSWPSGLDTVSMVLVSQ